MQKEKNEDYTNLNYTKLLVGVINVVKAWAWCVIKL